MEGKVLVLGKGFIGDRLQQAYNCAVSARRISNYKEAEEEIDKYNPQIIINTIGHIGERYADDCELDKDQTIIANTLVPIILAELALRRNIKLVHFSSGCIYYFDYTKDQPLTEDRPPDFYDLFYSRAKIYAERALETLSRRCGFLIIRIRMPIDYYPNRRNLLTKLIKYKRVIDIPNSVIYVPDLIDALRYLIEIDAKGIYNIVNNGTIRYPELLDIYKKYVPDFKYEVISYAQLGLTRTNIILSNEKLKAAGFKMGDIFDNLDECVRKYVENETLAKSPDA